MRKISFIKHLFKLIWNRKKTNFLITVEIFISFFVLFVVSILFVYYIQNYNKPLGFNYDNVWSLNMQWKNTPVEEIRETMKMLNNKLGSENEILDYSFSNSFIFQPMATSYSTMIVNGKKINPISLQGGDDFNKVLGVELTKGRWFNDSDNGVNFTPIVINRKYENLIQEGSIDNIIGKAIYSSDKEDPTEYRIIGVIDDFRSSSDFSGTDNIVFFRIDEESKSFENFVRGGLGNKMLLKVKANAGIEYEQKLIKELSSIAKDWMLDIEYLSEKRITAMKTSLIFPAILFVISLFLVFNVAIGLFGVIWQNISKRRNEIGLRRALGSSASVINIQIVGEVIALTTFGVILGAFFAIQIPILNIASFISMNTYYIAFGISVLLIYIITMSCAIYPGIMASRIEPAMALHDN